MPTLNWLGKEKVVTYSPPFHLLNKIYNHGGATENKIIHGDNLLALKSLLPEFEGRIKCVYIDPPYNTGNEGWIYNDNVNSPQIQKWLGKVVGKEGEDFTRHDKWLCMMYPRLRLLKKLLAEDGAIFISIDDMEQMYLKVVCDEIFGKNNFVAQFCIKRSGGRQDSKFFAVTNEFLLCCAKNINEFVAGEEIKSNENFPKFDKQTGKFYKTQLLRKWGSNSRRIDRPNLFYSIPAPDGSELFPMLSKTEEGRWRWGKNKMQDALEKNLIEFVKKNGEWIAYEKIFQTEDAGTKKFTTWIDENFSGADDLKDIFGEKVFDYPKAVGLIEKILRMCNVDKNAIILDAFAGSGTTAHAVINLNKQDDGNRKFILVEMEEYAEKITAERVRRVGGSFDFYEIGEQVFDENEMLNGKVPLDDLRDYVYFSEVRKHYVPGEEKYLLGVEDGTAYYFFHEHGKEFSLSYNLLAELRTKAERYVIYAAKCFLTDEELEEWQIEFRQIPFDVQMWQ